MHALPQSTDTGLSPGDESILSLVYLTWESVAHSSHIWSRRHIGRSGEFPLKIGR